MARRGAAAIPIYEVEPPLLFFNLFTLLGAIGDRGSFVDDRPTTGLDKGVVALGKGSRSSASPSPSSIITGKVALTQLNIETSVPVSEIESLVLFNVSSTIAMLVTGHHSPISHWPPLPRSPAGHVGRKEKKE
uniref:Uncharacterized protein n=1 Tax=Oryza meridionalis TaxID=40149 RepID=A0A0E0DMS2_9ORYZ